MKRFKLIFHIIYILITLVVMYFSIDILMNTEEYLSKVKLSAYIKFPKYIMGIFLFMSVLMIVEFILRIMSLQNVRGQVGNLEKEVMELKAKLYDKGQIELPQTTEEEEDNSVSKEDDEDDEYA